MEKFEIAGVEVSEGEFKHFEKMSTVEQLQYSAYIKGRPELAKPVEPEVAGSVEPEYTGGSSSYYLVHVANPTTKGMAPYTAECNDIIEALGMNYAEGNAFKAIWRRKAAELGKLKKGYDSGLYDAEKVVFFGERMVVQSKAKNESH